ncbi:MAG: ABC transporter ATP-binding protein [Chloroflexaceae bacterium]|nr:ABC transporter ATP-binding protein [Chloroflexaceae bacterium]
MTPEPILRIRGLKTQFQSAAGVVRAVDGVDLDVYPGEIVGIVGESGSGKSALAFSILRLTTGRIVAGEVQFRGQNLLDLREAEMEKLRGDRIAMIFQDPMTSLNPLMRVGKQIGEALRYHLRLSRRAATAKAAELLQAVHLPDARRRVHDYPHQLSGGQRQRVAIAMGISCTPDLLIADEPTTALDVTIQAQILNLISETRQRTNTAVLLITHDLGVVAQLCDRVAVMYAGQVVEQGRTADVFADPQHPYTIGLLGSTPHGRQRGEPLRPIPGQPPRPGEIVAGCPFAPRCTLAEEHCRRRAPDLIHIGGGRHARCLLRTEVAYESAS